MDLFFPSKLLDYMATGKPILAITNKTSTTHEVIDGKFGYCFGKDQLTEMAETIIDLSINLLENKPIPLLKKGVDEYSVETNVGRLENVLNFAIG